MEKQGMVRGGRFHGTGLLGACGAGLLGLLLFFCPSPALDGQEAGEGTGEITARLESSPERPVLDGTWRIIILVDHPLPDEVTVIPPELPASLSFAQSRKETRFIETPGEQGRRWTRAEFLFVPHRTGDLALEPFEVLVGDSRILTPAARTTVTTREGARVEYHPRLAWDAPPPVLRIGEAAELTLRVLGSDPRLPLRRLPLRVTAPEQALLEELPLTGEEADRGLALRLRVIPLGGNRISLGPFSLPFETLTLESPVISIALARPPGVSPLPPIPPPAVTAFAEQGDAAPGKPLPAFPEAPEEPPLFRNAYRKTLGRSREYWEQGRYAEALGELRRGERDLLSGPALVSTRRSAERLLGLPPTADETWRPRNFFFALILLGFCLLLPAIALLLKSRRGYAGKKTVTSLFFHGYSIVVFVLIGVMGFGVAALTRNPAGFRPSPAGFPKPAGLEKAPQEAPPGTAAVALRFCTAYRVPDLRGAISARWMEGQPVRVRSVSAGSVSAGSVSDTWAYAESFAGDAGWVRQDDLVFY
ncbi:MAG: hypothetical protein LBK63_07695 [Treponema sp.]|jgi:hypothetical protein|nr:hypothetical protein [Treponema sp.]